MSEPKEPVGRYRIPPIAWTAALVEDHLKRRPLHHVLIPTGSSHVIAWEQELSRLGRDLNAAKTRYAKWLCRACDGTTVKPNDKSCGCKDGLSARGRRGLKAAAWRDETQTAFNARMDLARSKPREPVKPDAFAQFPPVTDEEPW